MEKLKPCPFCGGEAYANWWAGYAHGECEECGACGEDVKPHENETMEQTEARAIKAWNKRVERTCHVKSQIVDNETGELSYFCSMCGFEGDPQDWAEYFRYCPACGAKVVDDE